MSKARLSVTVEEDLLEQLDQTIGDRKPFETRSAAVEHALRLYLRAQHDREVAAYYASQKERDRAEDRALAKASERSFAELEIDGY